MLLNADRERVTQAVTTAWTGVSSLEITLHESLGRRRLIDLDLDLDPRPCPRWRRRNVVPAELLRGNSTIDSVASSCLVILFTVIAARASAYQVDGSALRSYKVLTIGHCGGAFNEAPLARSDIARTPNSISVVAEHAAGAVCSSGETEHRDVGGIKTAEKRGIDTQNIQRLVRWLQASRSSRAPLARARRKFSLRVSPCCHRVFRVTDQVEEASKRIQVPANRCGTELNPVRSVANVSTGAPPISTPLEVCLNATDGIDDEVRQVVAAHGGL